MRIRYSVTYLYPFLRLLKRGVCGRLGRRVMLMRLSYVCNRTCHWRRSSALQVLKPVEMCKSSSVPRYSTEIGGEPRQSARSSPSVVGVAAAAAAPARRTDHLLLSGIAPAGVWGQTAGVKSPRVTCTASGGSAQNKSLGGGPRRITGGIFSMV